MDQIKEAGLSLVYPIEEHIRKKPKLEHFMEPIVHKHGVKRRRVTPEEKPTRRFPSDDEYGNCSYIS